MKKLTIIFILIINLNANNNYELKLYEQLLPKIFSTNIITVFADKKTKELLSKSDKFILVDNCDDAIVIIGKNLNKDITLCQYKPHFNTSYKSFNNSKNSFGAFYWRKGRPQIRFKLDAIKKYNLDLPSNLKKYAR